MDTIDNDETPKRRIEDHTSDAKLDWTKPDAPAVPAAAARAVPLRAVASMSVSADGISFFATPAAHLLEHGHYMLQAPGAVKSLLARPHRDHNRAAAPIPDWISYDESRDSLTIHGVTYSGELMREFGHHMPQWQMFELVARQADGALCVKRIEAAPAAPAAPAVQVIDAPRVEVPEGWKLVPDRETPEWRENLSERGYSHKSIFRDVLAAAPAAPIARQAQPTDRDVVAPHGFWEGGEWYGFHQDEQACNHAEGDTVELVPIWTHGKPVNFVCVKEEGDDCERLVPATEADAALLKWSNIESGSGSTTEGAAS